MQMRIRYTHEYKLQGLPLEGKKPNRTTVVAASKRNRSVSYKYTLFGFALCFAIVIILIPHPTPFTGTTDNDIESESDQGSVGLESEVARLGHEDQLMSPLQSPEKKALVPMQQVGNTAAENKEDDDEKEVHYLYTVCALLIVDCFDVVCIEH